MRSWPGIFKATLLIIPLVITIVVLVRGRQLWETYVLNMGLVALIGEAYQAELSQDCLRSAVSGIGGRCLAPNSALNCGLPAENTFVETRRLLSQAGDPGLSPRFLGVIDLAQGELKVAASTLEAKRSELDFLGRFMLGNLNMADGNSEQGLVDLGNVRDSEMFYVNLGISAQLEGKGDQALDCFQDALQIRSNAAAQYHLAQTLMGMKSYDEALEAYNTLTDFDKEPVQLSATVQESAKFLAFRGAGQVANMQNNWEQAVENMQLALELKPDDAILRSQLSLAVYHNSGDMAEAFEQVELAVASDPGSIWPLITRGRLYEFEDQYDEAIVQYQMAARLDPGAAPPFDYLSRLWLRQGKETDARDALEKAVQLDPQNINYWERLCALEETNIGVDNALKECP